MGRLFTVSLEGKFYTCKHCGTHLTLHEDVVAKSFKCKDEEVYLFSNVVNVTRGELLDRIKARGLHTIAVVLCVGCGAKIGWSYECTQGYRQKYEDGKLILEGSKLSFHGPDELMESARPNHDARDGGSDA